MSSSVKNSIAATQGLVFAQDVDGHLYAVDASAGQLIWEKQLDVMGVPALNDGLVVSGDTVFAGSGEGLCAVEASSGREYWKNTSWKQGEGTTATLSSGTGVLVGSVQWDALYGNDIRTGKLLWRVEKEGVRNRASSPAIHGRSNVSPFQQFFVCHVCPHRADSGKEEIALFSGCHFNSVSD